MAGTPPQGTIASLISKLTDRLNEHPGEEELLGAIPLIAGAWLSASPRRGWQGVGNALAATGGLTEYDAQTRVGAKADKDALAQSNRAWQQFAGGLKPGEAPTDVIKGAAGAGVPVPQALSVWKDYQTKPGAGEEQAYQDAKAADPKLTRLEFHKQWVEAGKGRPEGPKSAFALWLAQNPNGTYADFENQSDAIRAKYQKPTTVNVGFGGYGLDASGNPVALERNPKTGTVSAAPLPKGVVPAGLKPKPKYAPGQIVQVGGVNGGSYQYRNGAKGIGLYRIGKKGLYTSAKEALGGASLPDFIDPNGEVPTSSGSSAAPAPPPGFE